MIRGVERRLLAQAQQLEDQCYMAMTMQEYWALELLCIVNAPGVPPAVASMLTHA